MVIMVVDHKPAHIIVRPQKSGGLLRDRQGELAYALVDSDAAPSIRLCNFELMQKVSAVRKHSHPPQDFGSRLTN